MINLRLYITEKNIVNIQDFNEISRKKLTCNICNYIVQQPLYCHNCLMVCCKNCCDLDNNNCSFGCKRNKLNDITEFYNQEYCNMIIKCPLCDIEFTYQFLSIHICEIKKERLRETEKNSILKSSNKEKLNEISKSVSKREKVKCNFCFKEIILDDIEFHLKLECALSLTEVKCEYCLKLYKEDEILSHIKICEIRVTNSCPECDWFTKDKKFLEKHIYLCKNGLQVTNKLYNSINKSKFFKDDKLQRNIKDIGVPLNSNHYVYTNEINELEFKIQNLNMMLVCYNKSFEQNFCRKCGIVSKNKDLVICNECNKFFCCNCCTVCLKCNLIADKICLKSCALCKDTFCKECDKQYIFNCICQDEKICSKCAESNTLQKLIHICRYFQVVETQTYAIKSPDQTFNCDIIISNYNGNSFIIYFLDNVLLQVFKREINIKNDEIVNVKFTNKEMTLSIKNYQLEKQCFEEISYIVLSFNKNFSIDKALKIMKDINFSFDDRKKLTTNIYPIKEIKFLMIK